MKKQEGNQQPIWRQRLGRLFMVVSLLLSGGPGVAATAVTASATAIVVTATVVAATPDAAQANVPAGYRNMSYSGGTGYAVWDNCYTSSCHDYYYASVTAGAVAGGYCLITGYDWKIYELRHHDSRVVRSCKSWAFHESYGVFEVQLAGWTRIGMQKLGQCYGPQYAETGYGCLTQSDAEGLISSISLSSTCNGSWTRLANNATVFNTGGDPTQCQS